MKHLHSMPNFIHHLPLGSTYLNDKHLKDKYNICMEILECIFKCNGMFNVTVGVTELHAQNFNIFHYDFMTHDYSKVL